MGFFGKFFVAIFAVCAARGAWANCTCQWDTCDDNEYCNVTVSYPYPGNPEYSYECTPCPSGQVPSNSCLTCVPAGGGQYCDSFEENCPGLGLEYRCKIIDQDCGSGCKKYQSCNSINGNLGPDVVSENCHIEGENCYANEVPCRAFDIDMFAGPWSCDRISQTGYAHWETDKWDTLDCACSVVNKDIDMAAGNTVVNCQKANAIYYVALADRYRTRTLSDSVHYSIERSWCAQCYPGYLPDPMESPSNGILTRPDDAGNWGVMTCGTMVREPDYATGCVIDFSLSTGLAAQTDPNCRKVCPTGSATDHDGAQSIDDCITDYSQTYEDGTGWFVLGGFETCP